MTAEFPSHAEVLAQHLRYQDRPHRGPWSVFCSCESGKWFSEPIEVISDETYVAHVQRRWDEACTVKTVAGLDSLPVDTVIRSNSGRIWLCVSIVHMHRWIVPGVPQVPVILGGGSLPARVIHHPDWATT